MGTRMNKYEDKESAKDDYSHEKKLGADARWDMEHGRGKDAGADIDHAHALKRDAHFDAEHRRDKHYRHPILKRNHSPK